MAEIKNKPTLKDLQEYVAELCVERGWDKDTYLEKFLLFTEEVGEFAKAIRDHEGIHYEEAKTKKKLELEEELADVFNYVLDLANYFEIDLESAFRKKMGKNEGRSWIRRSNLEK